MDFNYSLELTKKMISFDTFNVEGKTEILNYVKEVLNKETDADVKVYNTGTNDVFLIAHLKVNNPQFTFMLEGHIDVVDTTGMVVEPFNAKVEGDILYGRGACDMKSGCSAMMTAFILASKDEKRKGDIYLVFTSDEEYAGAQINYIMENNLTPNCDFVMIAEPMDGKLVNAHNGNAWVDVEFFGVAAHASLPELGLNAVDMACKFSYYLKEFADKYYPTYSNEVYGYPRMNIGVINGGTQPNIVPEYAKVRLDKRYLPGDTIETFLSEIDQVIERCKKEDENFNAKINVVVDCSACEVKRDNPILQTIKKSIEKSINRECEYGVGAFWGEGGYINKYGIPVAYYGVGSVEYAHTKNEQCSISQLNEVTKSYYEIIKELCF